MTSPQPKELAALPFARRSAMPMSGIASTIDSYGVTNNFPNCASYFRAIEHIDLISTKPASECEKIKVA
jgi:hypothetical protein